MAIINSFYEYGSTGALTKQLYQYGKRNGFYTFVFYGWSNSVADDNVIKIDSIWEIYFHKLLTLIKGY